MTDCPQFQNVAAPQVVPIYRPPSPTIVPFPVPGRQPIFHPIPFGCPPVAWSPIHHHPPPPTTPQQQPADDDGDGFHCPVVNGVPIRQQPQLPPLPVYFSGSVGPANESQPALQHWLPLKQQHSRRASGKFDSKYEEFRKYLDQTGILSTFTNILTEMYEDPLRYNNPLGIIREKLSCLQSETIELSNLRLWCKQYQIKTERLEKELKHVIERLRKYEPYDTDDSFFNKSSLVTACESCVLEVSKGHGLRKRKENGNYESFINNNQ